MSKNMNVNKVKNEDAPDYAVDKNKTDDQMESDRAILKKAAGILEKLATRGPVMDSPATTAQWLRFKLATLERETFSLLLLDTRHRMLSLVELFAGTIDSACVYPREVVKTVLAHNASAVILVHNHPSGDTNPSEADRKLTMQLIRSLELIDVRVLDHFIVGVEGFYSFADHGEM